jgi:hypothetical protein
VNRHHPLQAFEGALLTLVLAAGLLAGGEAKSMESSARRLPDVIVKEICERYDGKAAFEAKDETTRIDCEWVGRMAVLSRPTPIEEFRRVLDQAATLTELEQTKLPADVACGAFRVQIVGGNRMVVCRGEVDEMGPYVFFGDAKGTIQRLEMILDYESVYRAAMRRSMDRGKISGFSEAYIDLNADIMLAKLRFTATPLDTIRVENGRISIVLNAPKRAPKKS